MGRLRRVWGLGGACGALGDKHAVPRLALLRVCGLLLMRHPSELRRAPHLRQTNTLKPFDPLTL